jgi:nitroreductase
MDIPFARWYSAIETRRSRRHFDPARPIESEISTALDTVCKQFRPFPHARTCLVTDSVHDVFKGIVGGYGKIKDSPAFIAFIGNMDSPYVQEEVGYTGEGVILEATALGLNTCWVGGFFKPESVASHIEISKNERVLSVTPVGYTLGNGSIEEKIMTGFGRTHKRLPVLRLVSGTDIEKSPEWVKASVEAARLAPSAVNRQPWSFNLEDNCIRVSVRTGGLEFNVSKRLDCGIAMLHIEIAARVFGVNGEWEFLQSPQVAKFVVPS